MNWRQKARIRQRWRNRMSKAEYDWAHRLRQSWTLGWTEREEKNMGRRWRKVFNKASHDALKRILKRDPNWTIKVPVSEVKE